MKNMVEYDAKLSRILEIVFLAFIFFLPFMDENGLLTFECGFTIYPSYLFGFLSLVLLSLIKISNKDTHIITSSVDCWLAAFIAVIFLSVLQSRFIISGLFVPMSGSVSVFTRIPYLRSLSQAAAMLFMVLIYFLVLSVVNDKRMLKNVVMTIVITTSAVCILGIFAVIEYNLLKRGWIRHQILSSLIIDPLASGNRGLRLRGLTPEPLIFGAYLASFIPIAISVYLARWFNKRFMQAAILLSFAALFFTFSRGGWLGLIIALAVMLVLNFKKAFSALLKRCVFPNCYFTFILLLLIASSVFYFNQSKIASETGEKSLIESIKHGTVDQAALLSSIKNIHNVKYEIGGGDLNNISPVQWGTLMRLNDIVAGLKMFADHPVLGIGWGNYIFQYLRYDPKIIGWWWIKWPETQNRPGTPVCCNLFVSIAAETGLVGCFVFVILIAAILRLSIRGLKNCHDSGVKMVMTGLLASLVAVTIAYQFFSTFYYPFFWVFLALLIVCGRVCINEDEGE